MGTIEKVTTGDGTHLIATTAFATCPTAAATVAKVATVQDNQTFTLLVGMTIHVKFTYSNTATNPTLNVNSTGAKEIKRCGTIAPNTSAATSWQAGAVISLTYDGTYWMMGDWLNNNTVLNLSPYIIAAGTTITGYTWSGSGFITNSSKDLYTVITFNKVITASSVAVSALTMTTRQNNKYTHGSSADSKVAWTASAATVSRCGVALTATRSTITNATNNDAIGIQLTGTFKFT